MQRNFKNLAEQMEYEYIQQLKSNKDEAFPITSDGKISYLKILNRGEQLFYQEDNRALICEISVIHDVVIDESIKKWDSGEKVTDKEKNQIRKNIERFFAESYQTNIRFI